MVDAAYEELYEFLRPGVRENECVGLVSKVLYDLGIGARRGRQRDLGRAVLAAPARLHRPADPARRPGLLRHPAQPPGLPDLLLPHASPWAAPRRRSATPTCVCREYMDHAIALVKPGATTADIVAVWPTRAGVRLRRRGGGVRAAVRPRRRPVASGSSPIFSRLDVARHPETLEEGMVFALETYWPADDGWARGPDRGGARRHRRRLRGHHQVPGRGAAGRRPALLHDRRPAADDARQPVPPEHPPRRRRSRMSLPLSEHGYGEHEPCCRRRPDRHDARRRPRRRGCGCIARCRRCASSRSAPTTCSCSSSSRAPATCRSAWRPSRPASAPRMRPDDYTFATYRGHAPHPGPRACR